MRSHDAERPALWLTENAGLLPCAGRALDVACGRGRHALWLASAGFVVDAMDRDMDALAELDARARAANVKVRTVNRDLEAGQTGIPAGVYAVVVVVHYLHRPLFPALVAALRPGGVLVYETFTTAQAARGKPTNPAFLLQPGELVERLDGLELLRSREGEFEGRDVASVIARRPPA